MQLIVVDHPLTLDQYYLIINIVNFRIPLIVTILPVGYGIIIIKELSNHKDRSR